MLQILGVALLVVAVLGGISCGPWLIAALLAHRRDQPDLVIVFSRRASTTALVLGALAVLFPLGRAVAGEPWTTAGVALVVAGLLLVAAGLGLRRLPV